MDPDGGNTSACAEKRNDKDSPFYGTGKYLRVRGEEFVGGQVAAALSGNTSACAEKSKPAESRSR